MSLNLTLWPLWPLSQQVSWWSGVNHDVDVCVSEEQEWLQVCLLCSCLSAGPCRSEGAADGSWKQCRPNESRESEVTSTDAAEFTASWRCSAWNQHDNLTIRRVIEESQGGEGDGGGVKWNHCNHIFHPDTQSDSGAVISSVTLDQTGGQELELHLPAVHVSDCGDDSACFFFFFTPVWENSCPLQPQHWVNINNKYG